MLRVLLNPEIKEMSMKLYYAPGACSMSDHIALEWIGKPYTAQKMTKEGMKSPEYLKLNPAGAVPVLENDGWALTQNAAILNYLADTFPEAGLGGDGTPKGRAEINRWLSFFNADVHPAFHPLFGATSFLDDAAAEQTRDKARSKLRDLFGRADKQLQGRDWIAGTRSIADPYLFVTLRWAKGMNVDLSGYDNLAKFVERMSADPSVRKVLAEEGLDNN
jgi:glutathione S-transferase